MWLCSSRTEKREGKNRVAAAALEQQLQCFYSKEERTCGKSYCCKACSGSRGLTLVMNRSSRGSREEAAKAVAVGAATISVEAFSGCELAVVVKFLKGDRNAKFIYKG
ncbi:hypothetical protein F0562_010777 [Nyssa sinensis]|uniref:Uncharacterized protein n=1 Tax=Nyssa sinensis TaxID=561372 RepID=A0A5J5A2C9_9ASTE|nr:hypothetical protein F0562_010777 [Nyssa sinensis]